MDSTPRLAPPYLMPNQAQKHVTLNEALKALDVMTNLSVRSCTVAAQPASPSDGDAYILPAGAGGAHWAELAENSIAAFFDTVWTGFKPPEGCRAWVEDDAGL